MSPEQARGKSLDKRTDIWSFACCLYEALSGRPAFLGETVSDTLAKILQTEPELGALPSETPPRMRDLIARGLVKAPENRLRDIGDARLELRLAPAEPEDVPRATRRSPGWMLLVGASIALGIVAVWGWMRTPEPRPRSVFRSVLPLPAETRLVVDVFSPSVAISPDGRHVAYIVGDAGEQKLYLRTLETLEDRLVARGVVRMPFFSPDSRSLAFENRQRLMKVSVSGGAPTVISELRASLYGADWGEEAIVFSDTVGSGLQRVGDVGTAPERMTSLDEARREKTHRLPDVLPDDAGVLFTLAHSTTESYSDASVAVVSETGEYRTILEGGTHGRYSETGHLVYARAGSLFAVPFDIDGLEVTGPPVSMLTGVIISDIAGAAQFDLATNGTLVYAPGRGRTSDRRIVWVDRSGEEEVLVDASLPFNGPRLSPDGRYVLSQVHGGIETIWLYDISRATLTRVTSEWDNGCPVWAPDGEEFAFMSARGGPFDLYKQPAYRAEEAERLVASPFNKAPTSWSPDGDFLAYQETTTETGADLWTVELEGERQPTPFLNSRANEAFAAFSPDGQWIAYQSDESGEDEIYLRRFPGAGDMRQVSTSGGTYPVWNKNGRELFYRNGDEIVSVSVSTEKGLVLGRPQVLFERALSPTLYHTFDVTPDGTRFIDLDDSVAEKPPIRLVLVQNFDEELKRLVPTDN